MAILRSMAIGHLVLGGVLVLGSIIVEVLLREPTFFGLTASGVMLGACGLIALLAANRQRAQQSPLAFYLLPYADFAIVGLWLLLFGVSGPMLLFYAYVVVSAALLLGSRHAITLAGLAGATILATILGQYQGLVSPAIVLPQQAQFAFTAVATILALGLIVAVARLFSLNLDRFIALTNRQNDEIVRTRRRMTDQQEQIQGELEHLSNTYMRFISGDTQARAPVSHTSLALASHILNTLLDHTERLLRTAATRTRMEDRISELTQAVDRLSNGDTAALQAISTPSGTSLDTLTLSLARAGRQLILVQQALQHAAGGYVAVMGIAADLSLLHQTLSSTDSAVYDLQMRSAQSAARLHAMLDSEGSYNESRSTDRPFLREMELRSRQQSAGLELLRTRLGHISSQMEAVENDLRRIAEGMEQITRGSRPSRTGQPGTLPVDPATSNPLFHPPNAPSQIPDNVSPSASVPPRPTNGPLWASDGLPRRFNGPLAPPDRTAPEKSELWQELSWHDEYEISGPQH